MKVSVIGSGAWGTALAVSLAANGHCVTLHSINSKHAEQFYASRQNPRLAGVTLPQELSFSDEYTLPEGTGAVVMATPSFGVRRAAGALRGFVGEDTVIITASKGIEYESNLCYSSVIAQELGHPERIAVLSGPSHAEEVGRGLPTGCVAAAETPEVAEFVQDLFMTPNFRIYTSGDPVGVELCGALKNVFAIGAGICFGLGYGDNAGALMMTRALAEMKRLGSVLGGNPDTFSGLAGMGDLIVTCMSRHSRNRRAGEYIGQGMSTEQAMERVGAVVEGYYAANSVKHLADLHATDMPIAGGIYSCLYEGRPASTVVAELMSRSKRHELD